MKALPKLSKAQQEAWARILEWHATNPNNARFYAAGVSDFAIRAGRYFGNGVPGNNATFKALASKGLLESAGRDMGYDLYTIHPDYLPTPTPAPVEPVAEAPAKPAPVTAPSHYTPKEGRVTPLRRQYLDIKAQYPDSILLFRLGDFYETFDHDAEIFSRVCDLVLTSRPISKTERIPMAGVPHHAVNQYIEQLLKAGHHVAVCEQVSEPQIGSGVVDRAVTKTYKPTPAVVTPAAPVEDAPVANEPDTSEPANEPKFKVGDKVRRIVNTPVVAIAETAMMIGGWHYKVTGNYLEDQTWYGEDMLEPAANDTINHTAVIEMALELQRQENAKLTSQIEALRAWYGEMKTRRDIDITRLLDTINDLQEERDTLMAQAENMRTIVVNELQGAIDNAPPRMRLAAIEQYIIDNKG